jgi:hypothetical protein
LTLEFIGLRYLCCTISSWSCLREIHEHHLTLTQATSINVPDRTSMDSRHRSVQVMSLECIKRANLAAVSSLKAFVYPGKIMQVGQQCHRRRHGIIQTVASFRRPHMSVNPTDLAVDKSAAKRRDESCEAKNACNVTTIQALRFTAAESN